MAKERCDKVLKYCNEAAHVSTKVGRGFSPNPKLARSHPKWNHSTRKFYFRKPAVVLPNPPNAPVVAGPNVTFPNNKVDLGLFFGGSSAVFFAREEAKKLGTAGEDLLSEPGVLTKTEC